MRSFFSFGLFILFFPLISSGQGKDLGEHRLSIRGDLQAVHAGASALFQDRMNGIIGADLSLQVPFGPDLYFGAGGNFSSFERAGDPVQLVRDETTMASFAPFIKAGYRPYLSRIFYLDINVMGSYRFMEFNAPRCEQEGRKEIHTQSSFSATPKIGLWWDTGDGLDFGAVVGHEIIWERFRTDLICEELEPEPPENDSRYRWWHFGFAFSADLVSE